MTRSPRHAPAWIRIDDAIQDIVDTNFDLYKRITDDRPFGDALKELLFELYLKGKPPT